MLNATTIRAHTSALFGSFDKLGLSPPEPVEAARQRLVTVTRAYEQRPLPRPDDLALATIAALEAGTDPATDPRVQAITTARALTGDATLRDGLAAVLTDGLRNACRAEAEALVEVWRPAFDRAAATLTDAHRVLGDIALDDHAAVVRLGPAGTEAWADATDAATTIATIHDGWAALAALLTGSPVAKRHRLLAIADIDANTWLEENMDNRPADPWAAVVDGFTLDLPTIDGHRRRVAAVDGARVERDRVAADAHRRRHREPAA